MALISYCPNPLDKTIDPLTFGFSYLMCLSLPYVSGGEHLGPMTSNAAAEKEQLLDICWVELTCGYPPSVLYFSPRLLASMPL